MYSTIITIFTACALIPQVFAGVYITGPVLGSTGQGGQSLTISWKDDGLAPSLADIGPCEFGVFSGNMQQQTELQPVNPSVDVSKQTTLDFKIDPTIGPNSGDYFIRVTSQALKDTKNPQFPYEAFSAKFTLSSMSGQFSPVVQAQINGVTSAVTGPSSAPTSAATPVPSVKATTTSAGPAQSTAASSSAGAAKATPSNAALMTRSNARFLGTFGVAAALLGLSL